ncbi:hypothetical protein HS7_14660 [Sulfolobales archaeon HS-7]|nr:hypothetical protein HS7_14660 [Sulfolobales archaeon HS-7]
MNEMLASTVVVWVSIALILSAAIIRSGAPGVLFAFIVLLVAIPVWRKVLTSMRTSPEEYTEIVNKLSSIESKLEEIKKQLEE